MKKSLLTLAGMLVMNSIMPNLAEAAIAKANRRLVVVSNLKTFGDPKYVWLYQFLDASTITMAQAVLGSSYQEIRALTPEIATRDNFKNTLKSISGRSDTQGVDVILSLHGADNKLWFKEGSYTTSNVQEQLTTIANKSKFRLMYNLACYGATHRNEFINSGFRTAIGSRKVNATSGSEYPEFLSRFALGHSVSSIIASSNSNPLLGVADQAARMMGFSDPDSYKLISGTTGLTINHNAQ